MRIFSCYSHLILSRQIGNIVTQKKPHPNSDQTANVKKSTEKYIGNDENCMKKYEERSADEEEAAAKKKRI